MPRTMLSLHDEGLKMYKKRKCTQAIQKFTLAIESGTEGNDQLKARCYANRAAAKQAAEGGVRASQAEVIADLDTALRLDAKCWDALAFRRKTLFEKGRYAEALVDSLVCEQQGGEPCETIEMRSLDMLVKQREREWAEELDFLNGERVVPVSHTRMFYWKSCYGGSDALLKDIGEYRKGGIRDEGMYSSVLAQIHAKKYEQALEIIEEMKSSAAVRVGVCAVECWLLAALLRAFKGQHEMSRECSATARELVSALPESDRKHALTVSIHVVAMHQAHSENGIKKAFLAGHAYSRDTRDLYIHAHLLLKQAAGDDREPAFDVLALDEAACLGQIRELLQAPPRGRDFFNTMLDREVYLRESELGLPPHMADTLIVNYHHAGMTKHARELAREMAERDGEAMQWYMYRSMCASMMAGRATREWDDAVQEMRALVKCAEIDPYLPRVNMALAIDELELYPGQKTPLRCQIERSQRHIERSLASFTTPLLPRVRGDMYKTFFMHEKIKVMLRANDVMGDDPKDVECMQQNPFISKRQELLRAAGL